MRKQDQAAAFFRSRSSRFRFRGEQTPYSGVLSNDIGGPVLRAIRRDVLDPEVVSEALDLALRDLEQPAMADGARIETLRDELARLEAELTRYAEAIAAAGPLATILQAVKVREQRHEAIRTELKTLASPNGIRTRE